MCAGIFGIICLVKSIRALTGSRETWKTSFVRVGKEGNALLWGAFSSASRTGLSRASLETREGMSPSFFPRELNRGRKERKRSTMSHAFGFAGGSQLSSISASWFVSYAYHKEIDPAHKIWLVAKD